MRSRHPRCCLHSDGDFVLDACPRGPDHFLNVTRCTTLMATHFHELTELGKEGSGACNLHVTAVVSADDITMTHTVLPGPR
jgi:hypothetical protein